MSTWEEMSRDCLKSAKNLFDAGLYRRSISSSYYAAYSAITAHFVAKGVTFAHGWNNPAHDQIANLIIHRLDSPRPMRFRLRKIILILRGARENADYRPNASIQQAYALECLRLATRTIQILEENNG